ncbi:MAG: DUF4349 domain-containing protein [Defluviitaleaceae bacterium]|nr:DUF4349 domain-containing protein [Defluviitaleaceae bacterium]
MKKTLRIVGLLIIIALLAACGGMNMTLGEASADMAVAPRQGRYYVAEPAALWSPADDFERGSTPDNAPRMLIRTARLNMQAVYEDFDGAMQGLRDIATDFGGFTESSSLNQWEDWRSGIILRTFEITLRVPVADFEQAIAHVEGLAHTISFSETAQDVTAEFFDTEGRLETRLIEEERVLTFINEATDLAELLSLERRLAQVRTEIQLYRGRIDHLKTQAAYSTIIAILNEVTEITPLEEAAVSLWSRITGGFGTSARGVGTFFGEMMVVLSALIIPLAIAGIITFTTIKIVRKIKRRRLS